MKKALNCLAIINIAEGKLLHGFPDIFKYLEFNWTLLLCGTNIDSFLQSYELPSGRIIIVEDERLVQDNPYILAMDIYSEINNSVDIIALPHSISNCGTAGYLAALLDMECFTGVNSLDFKSKSLTIKREISSGFTEEISLQRGCIVTLFPADLKESQSSHISAAAKISPNKSCKICEILGIKEREAFVELEGSAVLVAVGRGISSEENINLARELASLFSNSSIAASRPVCDNRWLPYKYQVGVTGKSVSPKLYFALGISGSSQHIAGMKNSRCIVSVNKDKNAPLSLLADYAIVEDVMVFIPAFINKIKEKK